MARSQSSAALKYVGAAAAAIVGGVAIGYLFGNARDTHPSVQTVPPPVSTPLTSAPSLSPSAIHPRKTNGNYTAPGAPHIVIEEESQPVLRRALPPSPPPPDPEATQEAPPPAPVPTAAPPKPADTTNTPPGSADTAPTAAPDTPGGSAAPSTPAPPADPDFEHVNGAPPSAPDPENGQQGPPTPGTQNPPGGGAGDSGKVQFRVQTGAYTDESNARSVADTLRSQGYATSTRSEREGDHLVYKVQVGAYRSKTGASKAADDLQKKGYPAFISPIAP